MYKRIVNTLLMAYVYYTKCQIQKNKTDGKIWIMTIQRIEIIQSGVFPPNEHQNPWCLLFTCSSLFGENSSSQIAPDYCPILNGSLFQQDDEYTVTS